MIILYCQGKFLIIVIVMDGDVLGNYWHRCHF